MIRLLFFLIVAGVVIYALVWLIQRARTANEPRRPAPAPPTPPDDDPVFLAQLDRRLREQRQREERERREREARRQAAADGVQTADTAEDAAEPDTGAAADDPEARES